MGSGEGRGKSRSPGKGHFLTALPKDVLPVTLSVQLPCTSFVIPVHTWVRDEGPGLTSLLCSFPEDCRVAKSGDSTKDCCVRDTDLESSQGFSKAMVKLLQRFPDL